MERTPAHTARHARPARTECWLHGDGDGNGTGEASRSAAAQELTAKTRKEALAHIGQDESQGMIQPLILELSVKISRRVALLGTSSSDPARSAEDLDALAWIQRSLEDVEATIIGLSEANRRRSAAFHGPAPSSAGSLVP